MFHQIIHRTSASVRRRLGECLTRSPFVFFVPFCRKSPKPSPREWPAPKPAVSRSRLPARVSLLTSPREAPAFTSVKISGASKFEQKATKGTKDVPPNHSPDFRIGEAEAG